MEKKEKMQNTCPILEGTTNTQDVYQQSCMIHSVSRRYSLGSSLKFSWGRGWSP